MRKLLSLAAVSALSLSLGACATSPYGYGADPLSTVLGVLGSTAQSGYGGYNGYSNQQFSQAAINACALSWKTSMSDVLPSQLLLTKGTPPS